ncbi:BTB/POZ domain-containing protein [Colletotrichum plurivorum]|uniref:BTB/POZ domain-containing protein n=1 Tax=Colletotrichum plurivorum TaxID=2175906 RepID=A0A8H6NGP0_9PEZI|nr:BTB/POZ domain-containing protein [Colletotrichum plurivorum]
MHDAAQRFGVSCLSRCAVEKLKSAAEKFWDSEGFLQAVELAYRVGGGDNEGRAVLVAVAAEHANELSDERAFCQLLDGVERFNAEFTAAVVKTEGIEMVEIPCGYCGISGECGCSRWSG